MQLISTFSFTESIWWDVLTTTTLYSNEQTVTFFVINFIVSYYSIFSHFRHKSSFVHCEAAVSFSFHIYLLCTFSVAQAVGWDPFKGSQDNLTGREMINRNKIKHNSDSDKQMYWVFFNFSLNLVLPILAYGNYLNETIWDFLGTTHSALLSTVN